MDDTVVKKKTTKPRKKAAPKIPDFLLPFVNLVEETKAYKNDYSCYRQPSLMDRNNEVALPHTILDIERACNALINNVQVLKDAVLLDNPDIDRTIVSLQNDDIIPNITSVIRSTLRLVETLSPEIDIFSFSAIEKTTREGN